MGGQFRAATRMADAPPEMLADVVLTNRERIADAHRAVGADVASLLSLDDRKALVDALTEAGRSKRRLMDSR